VGARPLEDREAGENGFGGAGVAAAGDGLGGEANAVQYVAELAGDGNAGDGGDHAVVVVVSKTHFAADVIVVEIELNAGGGEDLQIGAFDGLNGAGSDDHAAHGACGHLAQILAVAVRAEVTDDHAVFDELCGAQGDAVGVEAGAAGVAGHRAGHGQGDKIALGLLLDGVALAEEIGLGVDRGVVQAECDAHEHTGQLEGIEYHGAFQLLGLDGLAAGLDFDQLAADLLGNSLCVEIVEVVLLVELHALLRAVEGGYGLDHGVVAHLGLLKALAVGNELGVLVDEDLDGVQGRALNAAGKDRVGHLGGQLHGGVFGEIALDDVIAFFSTGQLVVGIADDQRLGDSLGDELVKLLGGSGGIDEELGAALEAVVVDVDGDFLVAGVGGADGLQLAIYIEELAAFLFYGFDLIIGDLRIFAQAFNDSNHPSFTFTFNAGPPSLTRAHSL